MANDGRLKRRWYLWAPLEKPCTNAVGKYCRFVARYPLPFIIIPVLLTCALSSGIFLNFEIVRGVHDLYTPQNAQWKLEDHVFEDGWTNRDDRFYPGKDVFRRKSVYLLAVAKNGGNILEPAHATQFIELLDWIANKVFVVDCGDGDGLLYTYRNICLHYRDECFQNSHARFVADIFRHGDQEHFNVTYPLFKSQFATEPIDLSQTLGGVQKDSRQRIRSAKAWMVLYQMQQNSELTRKLTLDFECALSKQIEERTVPIKLLDLYIFHSDVFEMELAKGSHVIAPRFVYTFLLLVTFSVLCTFSIRIISTPNSHPKSFPTIDWLLSKPLIGIIGVLTTLLAIISAAGLLLLLNIPFVDIVTMMPFLSLTIGIDDTFLMLAAWRSTNVKLSVEDRIEASMRHAAVSIAITSVTDTTAFLIGSIAPLPAVIYFCYYSAAAIVFTFFYSLSAFVAFLGIFGRWEKDQRNNLLYIRTVSFCKYAKASRFQRLFNMGGCDCQNISCKCSQKTNNSEKTGFSLCSNSVSRPGWYHHRILEQHYAPFIASRLIQIATLGLFVIYLTMATVGTRKLRVGFDVTNLLRDGSPAKKFLELREKFFEYKMPPLEIAVMKSPDMSRKSDRIRFLKALEEFERTNCSIGRETTEFWYFAYQRFVDDLGFGGDSWDALENDKEEFEQNLQPFLLANEKYRYDILFHDNGTIRAFRLYTQIANIPANSTELLIQCANEIRRTAERYETLYNITTYSPLWQLADQLNIMWPQTLQDLCVSVAVIIPISLLMIPQPLCSLVIALTIASIALGVIGFMAFWSVNLDATSMITIAMSVGFSVDFAVHITYSYISWSSDDGGAQYHVKSMPYERLRRTLETVGWPVFQASTSVLLGILPLAMVNSYVVQSCFKTVLLIIVIGTLHALLFLPLFLMQMHTFYLWLCRLVQTVVK